MLNIQNYKKVESLDEAYDLYQKRGNRVIGGMLWLKMSSGNCMTAIDLSGLGLDKIEEDENEFRIGAMVTLRQLEEHAGLLEYTAGAVKEALRHIVGVQFRNLATVGGSIYGRYGFSDVATLFMALDASVMLHKAGEIKLRDFVKMPYERDIVTGIVVNKKDIKINYQSARNTQTDIPVLTCAGVNSGNSYSVVIGSRPGIATMISDDKGLLAGGISEESATAFADYVAANVVTSTNSRGTKEYRSHLVKVLTKRAILMLGGLYLGN